MAQRHVLLASISSNVAEGGELFDVRGVLEEVRDWATRLLPGGSRREKTARERAAERRQQLYVAAGASAAVVGAAVESRLRPLVRPGLAMFE